MYREVVIRTYGEEANKKVDDLRRSGIDMTELLTNAIMEADIKALVREKRIRLETMEVNATITNERAKFVIDMAQQAKVNISKFIERCFANYIVVEKALKEIYGEAY